MKINLKLFFQIIILLVLFSALVNADLIRRSRQRRPGRRQFQGRRPGRGQFQGRQNPNVNEIPQGGVDFSGCINDRETGLCCVEKEETVTTIQKV